MKKPKHKPALMLNTDMMPIKVISWKRAICLSIIGHEIPGEGVTILKYYDDFVYSAGGMKLQIPAVVMTNRFINFKRRIYINKQSLFHRDGATCQYCGIELTFNSATIDHIKPKRLFANKSEANTWENVVLCCWPCNSKKGGKTLDQARMQLRSKPKPANPYILLSRQKYPEWSEFLQYN